MPSTVVVGGSRGLGAALAKELAVQEERIWIVSRSKPEFLDASKYHNIKWIKADLKNPKEAVSKITGSISGDPVSSLIFNAGIWERSSLTGVSEDEVLDIVNVNLSSAILTIRALVPNLKRSGNGQIILIGSTCGLENEGAQVVAYVSTKFGLRGVAHSVREWLRKDWISVTCISPGSMATDLDIEDGAEAALKKYSNKRMPVADIVKLVKCLTSLTVATCVKEIVVPATADTDV